MALFLARLDKQGISWVIILGYRPQTANVARNWNHQKHVILQVRWHTKISLGGWPHRAEHVQPLTKLVVAYFDRGERMSPWQFLRLYAIIPSILLPGKQTNQQISQTNKKNKKSYQTSTTKLPSSRPTKRSKPPLFAMSAVCRQHTLARREADAPALPGRFWRSDKPPVRRIDLASRLPTGMVRWWKCHNWKNSKFWDLGSLLLVIFGTISDVSWSSKSILELKKWSIVAAWDFSVKIGVMRVRVQKQVVVAGRTLLLSIESWLSQ